METVADRTIPACTFTAYNTPSLTLYFDCLFACPADANGNITQITAENGDVLAQYEYGPFGETIFASGTDADAIKFRFSTKYWDDETGTYYYGRRDYEPDWGRWPSRDPIWEMGGLNLYGFVGNAPPNAVDHLGLQGEGTGGKANSKSCCCCCVYNLYFAYIGPYTRPGFGVYGHEIKVRIDIGNVIADPNIPTTLGGNCVLFWEERWKRVYGSARGGGSLGEDWKDQTTVATTTFDDWNKIDMAKEPCPGFYTGTYDPITITDTPSPAPADPFISYVRDFRITVMSTPGCPCERNGYKNHLTIYGRQSATKNGEVNAPLQNLNWWDGTPPNSWLWTPPSGMTWPAL